MMRSKPSSMAMREPRLSKAPTRISDSRARFPTCRRSTRRAKSSKLVKGPPSARAARMASMAPWPTFFTAPRPNRMVALPSP